MQPPWIAQITGKRASSSALKQSISLLQRLLEGEPLRAPRRWRAARRSPAKTSSAMPAEKCLPVEESTSARVSPSSPSRAHRVADRREERRRHRVQPLRAVEPQVGDAVIVREVEEFAVQALSFMAGGR